MGTVAIFRKCCVKLQHYVSILWHNSCTVSLTHILEVSVIHAVSCLRLQAKGEGEYFVRVLNSFLHFTCNNPFVPDNFQRLASKHVDSQSAPMETMATLWHHCIIQMRKRGSVMKTPNPHIFSKIILPYHRGFKTRKTIYLPLSSLFLSSGLFNSTENVSCKHFVPTKMLMNLNFALVNKLDS